MCVCVCVCVCVQLPEDLISRTTRPVSIVWGEVDPWEDMTMAKQYFAHLPSVKEFVTLPGTRLCARAHTHTHTHTSTHAHISMGMVPP